MQIQNRPQINYKRNSAPNFTSFSKNVEFDKLGQAISTNNTWFFRFDLDWHKLANKLIEKYKDAEKVNIHCYACSDGAEPYSLAMLLIKKLGVEKAQKFFPIIASDIDPKILKNPIEGKINLSKGDISEIKHNIGNDYNQFIEHDSEFKFLKDYDEEDELCEGKVKPILKNAVVFSQKNITHDVSNLEKGNTVVMCRNFWPYITKAEQSKLAKSLTENLGDNSMCILGAFDTTKSKAVELLAQGGFGGNGVYNCYEKEAPKVQEALTNPEFLMNTFANQKKS